MNSAMKKGNYTIRGCLIFVIVVIASFFVLSEYAEARFIDEMPSTEYVEIDCE